MFIKIIQKCFCFSLLLVFVFIGCADNANEPVVLFEYESSSTGNFIVHSSTDKIIIENTIGYIFIHGGSDSSIINYVLNKKVRVKESSMAQAQFEKIYLDHSELSDSLLCRVAFPYPYFENYESSLNIDVPFNKSIIVRNANRGFYSSYLESDLYVNTANSDCTVDQHSGSVEAHTDDSNILTVISLPVNGFCKCYSNGGDIYVKIPIGSSANIDLKSVTGTVISKNLNINFTIRTDQELKGTLGSGEATIYLRTNSGNIVLQGY